MVICAVGLIRLDALDRGQVVAIKLPASLELHWGFCYAAMNTERPFDNACCRAGCPAFNVSELTKRSASLLERALLSRFLPRGHGFSRPAQKAISGLTLTDELAFP